MRVLVLSGDPGVPLYGPSGASAHLRGVVQALSARGHEVEVRVPRLSDHRGAVHDPVEVPVHTAPPRHWRWMGRFRERGETWDGRRLTRDARAPDLIWERYSVFTDAGARLAARSGAARIVELNAPLTQERPGIRDAPYARRKERESLTSATRVIAVSTWLTRWAKTLGCPDVRHVPNGTSIQPGDRARARRDLGLSGLVVAFVGSCKPWHGVPRLPAILDALPEATGLLLGTGPVEAPTHPRLRALGALAPARLSEVLAAADVGIAPYPSDAPPWFCPLKIADYRAAGLRVVATDLGDHRELVGTGGETVSGDDPSEWADAIRRQAGRPPTTCVRPWTTVVGEALDGLERG